MKFPTYVEPLDIARRILWRKPLDKWYGGPPEISLEGENGEFGVLCFEFEDDMLTYDILILDRKKILDSAHYFLIKAQQLSDEMWG